MDDNEQNDGVDFDISSISSLLDSFLNAYVRHYLEELEVLQSIYDGDEAFNQINSTSFQYKIGEDQHPKSFLLEINWGERYPNELPDIHLNAFYNKHIVPDVKEHIISRLKEEAEGLLSLAMTYTLFEYAKENAEELSSNQPDTLVQVTDTTVSEEKPTQQSKTKTKEKKEQLTKSQKRKMVNRLDNKGQLPRGHDWVDVIKHLSQTGGQKQESA